MQFKYQPPIIVMFYKCPLCGCQMNKDIDEYKKHFKNHQKTGMPFHVYMELPPSDGAKAGK